MFYINHVPMINESGSYWPVWTPYGMFHIYKFQHQCESFYVSLNFQNMCTLYDICYMYHCEYAHVSLDYRTV